MNFQAVYMHLWPHRAAFLVLALFQLY